MISVIIPAFNEEKNISKTLQSLIDQKYKEKFEVILVDNNSTDKTVKVASKFLKTLNLKIIIEKRRGRGNARATGVSKSNGEIVAFLDADTIATSNWLSVIEKSFEKENIVAVTGPWKFHDVDGATKQFMEKTQELDQLPYRVYRGHFWLNGMNMAILKSAYKKTKGFDRKLNAHEDIKITEELRKIGKIKYIRKMTVETSGRRYKKGVVKGLLTYIVPAIEHFVFKKEKIDLKDIR